MTTLLTKDNSDKTKNNTNQSCLALYGSQCCPSTHLDSPSLLEHPSLVLHPPTLLVHPPYFLAVLRYFTLILSLSYDVPPSVLSSLSWPKKVVSDHVVFNLRNTLISLLSMGFVAFSHNTTFLWHPTFLKDNRQ